MNYFFNKTTLFLIALILQSIVARGLDFNLYNVHAEANLCLDSLSTEIGGDNLLNNSSTNHFIGTENKNACDIINNFYGCPPLCDCSSGGPAGGGVTVYLHGSNFKVKLGSTGTWIHLTSNNHTFTGLSVGFHTVYAKNNDGTGCTDESSFEMPSRSHCCSININSVTATDVSCGTINTGKLTVNVSGENVEVSLNQSDWLIAANGVKVFSNLNAGAYTVYARETSDNSCSDSFIRNVNSQNGCCDIAINSLNKANPTCSNPSGGSITVNAVGSNLRVKLGANGSWLTAPGGSRTFSGLTHGNYTIYAKNNVDANCTDSRNISLNDPGTCSPSCDISINSISKINPTCSNPSGGSITVNASGSNLRVKLGANGSWQTTSGGSRSFSGLTHGDYTVYARNNVDVSCTDTGNKSLDNPGNCSPSCNISISSVTPSNVTCYFSNNGKINVQVNGDDPQVSLNGNNWFSATGGDHLFSNLSAGNYTVYAKEAGDNGCNTSYSSVIITDPNPCNAPTCDTPVTINKVHPTCSNANGGSITVSATGTNLRVKLGVNGEWESFDNTYTFNNLPQGDYTVFVKELIASSCTVQRGVSLDEPDCSPFCNTAINSLTKIDPSCDVPDGGSITVNAVGSNLRVMLGGTNIWVIPLAGSHTFTGLSSGPYTVYAKNNNDLNCIVSEPITINSPIDCESCDNAADITLSRLDCCELILNVDESCTNYTVLWEYSVNSGRWQSLANNSNSTFNLGSHNQAKWIHSISYKATVIYEDGTSVTSNTIDPDINASIYFDGSCALAIDIIDNDDLCNASNYVWQRKNLDNTGRWSTVSTGESEFQLEVSGRYRVQIVFPNSCRVITPNYLYDITDLPGFLPVIEQLDCCNYEITNIECSNSTPSIQWQYDVDKDENWQNIPGATTAILSPSDYSESSWLHNRRYQAIISNTSTGTIVSEIIEPDVRPIIIYSDCQLHGSVSAGSEFCFSPTDFNTAPLSGGGLSLSGSFNNGIEALWLRKNLDWSGPWVEVGSQNNYTPTQNGIYLLRYTFNGECQAESWYEFDIDELPAFVPEIVQLDCCNYEISNLDCTNSTPSIQWQYDINKNENWTNIPGATDAILSPGDYSQSSWLHNRRYQAIISNTTSGTITSEILDPDITATVSLYGCHLTGNLSDNANYCQAPVSTGLSASDLVTSYNGTKIEWFKKNLDNSGSWKIVSTSEDFNAIEDGRYLVRYTFDGGCRVQSKIFPFEVDNTSEPEICWDGIDNDCDGLVDCEDESCTPCNDPSLYASVTVVRHDNGTSSGEIKINISGGTKPYRITHNGQIHTTNKNSISFYNLSCGQTQTIVSSSDSNDEEQNLSANILQRLTNEIKVPLSNCINFSLTPDCFTDFDISNADCVIWQPEALFSDPYSLNTELCYTSEPISLSVVDVNGDILIEHSFNFLPGILDCPENPNCRLYDYFTNLDLLSKINDFEDELKNIQNTLSGKLNSGELRILLRDYGRPKWNKTLRIDKGYLTPVIKHNEYLASSLIFFLPHHSGEQKAYHLSRENTIQQLGQLNSADAEFNKSLFIISDIASTGVMDPNFFTNDEPIFTWNSASKCYEGTIVERDYLPNRNYSNNPNSDHNPNGGITCKEHGPIIGTPLTDDTPDEDGEYELCTSHNLPGKPKYYNKIGEVGGTLIEIFPTETDCPSWSFFDMEDLDNSSVPQNLGGGAGASNISSASQYFQDRMAECNGFIGPEPETEEDAICGAFQSIKTCTTGNLQYASNEDILESLAGKEDENGNVLVQVAEFICGAPLAYRSQYDQISREHDMLKPVHGFTVSFERFYETYLQLEMEGIINPHRQIVANIISNRDENFDAVIAAYQFHEDAKPNSDYKLSDREFESLLAEKGSLFMIPLYGFYFAIKLELIDVDLEAVFGIDEEILTYITNIVYEDIAIEIGLAAAELIPIGGDVLAISRNLAEGNIWAAALDVGLAVFPFGKIGKLATKVKPIAKSFIKVFGLTKAWKFISNFPSLRKKSSNVELMAEYRNAHPTNTIDDVTMGINDAAVGTTTQTGFLRFCLKGLGCFIKNTPVLMANTFINTSKNTNQNRFKISNAKSLAVAAAMPIVAMPIQDVQVDDMVKAYHHEEMYLTASNDADDIYVPGWQDYDYLDITPETWQVGKFVITEEDGNVVEIEANRPKKWFESLGVEKIGNSTFLVMEEFGVYGNAELLELKRTVIETRNFKLNENEKVDRPVITTFKRVANEISDYTFSNGQVISCTPNHPFYSSDRQAYIPVGELSFGETVQTAGDREVKFIRGKAREKGEYVYNFEVWREHNYFVGSEESDNFLLVHNTCPIKLIQDAIKAVDLRGFKINGKLEIPDSWVQKTTNSNDGFRYVHPTNPKIQIRVHEKGIFTDKPHNYNKPYTKYELGNGPDGKMQHADIDGNLIDRASLTLAEYYKATHIVIDDLSI